MSTDTMAPARQYTESKPATALSARDRLLALAKPAARRTVDVPAPELGAGETIRLRELDGDGRATFEEEMPQTGEGKAKKVTMRGMRELVVQLHVIDPVTGDLMFTPEERTTVIAKWPGTLNDRIFEAGKTLSALGKDETDKAVADLKNDRGSAG